jgi:NAD(P)-dependent dehydrogenase (short-subunit alcohol dehydrogenase family)
MQLADDGIAALCADAADADAAGRAVDLALTRFGRLDVVVNNAGRFLLKAIVDTTDEEWDGLMTTNVRSVTRQLAIEHAADGVRVNAIAPGAVDTAFVDNALAGAPDPRAARADIGASHPLGRMASPREIARSMVFLASPASSFMTGAVVMADGGYTAR